VTPLRSGAVPDVAAPACDAPELAGALAPPEVVVALLLDFAVLLPALFDAPAELQAASRVAATPVARTEMAGLDNLRTYVFPSDECHMQVGYASMSCEPMRGGR
jgi:hypothetical protein